jgi:hypothetical protein
LSKIFDPRECGTVKLVSININCIPIGSGDPTTWRAQASMSFMCYAINGDTLGVVQSGGSRIPYFLFLEGEKKQPTLKEVLHAWHSSKAQRDAWIEAQIETISGEILDL